MHFTPSLPLQCQLITPAFELCSLVRGTPCTSEDGAIPCFSKSSRGNPLASILCTYEGMKLSTDGYRHIFASGARRFPAFGAIIPAIIPDGTKTLQLWARRNSLCREVTFWKWSQLFCVVYFYNPAHKPDDESINLDERVFKFATCSRVSTLRWHDLICRNLLMIWEHEVLETANDDQVHVFCFIRASTPTYE